jgi:hypothetical protein
MRYVIVNFQDLVCLAEMGVLTFLRKFNIQIYISDFAIANCCVKDLEFVHKLIDDNILKPEGFDGTEMIKLYKDHKIDGLSITDIAAIYLCIKFQGILISNDKVIHDKVINLYPIIVENMDYLKENLKMRKAG